MNTEHFDFTVIGGGIFGCYAALYLAGRGARVCLIEKEKQLFRKASLVNQARLHSGYHYPRSIATAALSDEHKIRFTEEHRRFVNFSFEKYYAIDRYGSFTDARQFERFCAHLNIRCDRVEAHPLFNYERLEELYRAEEYSFDPVLLREYYTEKVENTPGIRVFKNTRITHAEPDGRQWNLTLSPLSHPSHPLSPLSPLSPSLTPLTPLTPLTSLTSLTSETVINATYAATNAVNRLFGIGDLSLTHEISEIAFVVSPQFQNKGLTVMDGPFGSVMPYGMSGLLSLTSVAYTHHKISYDNLPCFDCQRPEDPACKPEAPGICTTCPRRPESNAVKMLGQMQRYFADTVSFEYFFSYFTIKSKLKASYIDDSRPTEISLLRAEPRFFCLFSGKINSIYEVEKIV